MAERRPLNSTIGRSLPRAPAPLRWLLGFSSRLAPGVVAAWAARVFLTPRRRGLDLAPSASLPVLIAEPFVFEGKRISARHWGASMANRRVLLLHGWEGDSRQLTPLAAVLGERGFRGLLLDFPAHGQSEGRRTNFIEMAAVVRAAAERMGGPLDAVVAHSAGCVATLVALDRGLEVERLVLIAPASDLDGFGDAFALTLGLTPEVRRRFQQRIERRIGTTWSEIAPCRLAARIPPTPALVLHDLDDREIPPVHGIRLAATLPESELEITASLGHNRILRDPGVHRRVLEFLTRDEEWRRSPAAPAAAVV